MNNLIQNYKELMIQLEESQYHLNGLVTLIDPKDQLENLKNLDSSLPLYGQAVLIKDNISTKGIKTTASSKILDNYVPVYDAHVIDKLRDAGAIIVGKTTMDELAMGGTGLTPSQGATKNPYDSKRIAGGSSSGSAALTGVGLVDFALGTDTGDSIRKPAAYTGVVGLKPTYGRISRYGVIPYASSLDHVGFFTKNVLQSALMLEVLAGRDDRDLTSSHEPVDKYTQITGELSGKKIGVLTNVMDSISDDTKALVNLVLDQMREKGAIITEVSLDEKLMATLFSTYYVIANCEATANHANLDGIRFGQRVEADTLEATMKQSREAGFGSFVKRRFVVGAYGLEDQNQEEVFRKAQRVRRLLVDDLKKNMADLDGLLVLAAPGVAPLISEIKAQKQSTQEMIVNNHMVLGNFSGFPSITVPFEFMNGLPLGLNITAHPFKERDLLDMALGIEKLTNFDEKRRENLPQWLTK